MYMTLRHLAIFIKVCEENGITAAAKKLHMTQPSVSQVIQELEAHYQTLLFERLGRRIFITEAGRHFITLFTQSYKFKCANRTGYARF